MSTQAQEDELSCKQSITARAQLFDSEWLFWSIITIFSGQFLSRLILDFTVWAEKLFW